MIRPVHWIGLIAILLSGCLSVQNRNSAGPYVLTHHNWWNYYERGRLYLKAGRIDEARQDFETAMGRLPGARFPYAQERWRARTYGMHMIEGYFPHRELGICLFEQNRLPEALDLLETSMQMEPSARAKFYINRIHQRLAASSLPPRIEIIGIPDQTGQRTLLLKGSAIGINAIASVTINDTPEFIELAAPQISFHREIPLQEGRNLIRIATEDIAGNRTFTNLVLTADWTPPVIHLRRTGATLAVTSSDNLSLRQLQINDQITTCSGTELTLTSPLNPAEPLRLSAEDRTGNRVEWTLSQAELLHLAQNRNAGAPGLHITDAGKTITLFNPEYSMDILAEDDSTLRTVTLNGENLLARQTPLFRTLRRIPLVLGENRLTVTAEDDEGNCTEKQITVIRRNPEYLDRIYRLAAILSPIDGEVPEPSFGRRVDHLLGNELTLDPVRFYLLAGNEDIRQLRKEQDLSESKLADPRTMLQKNKDLKTDLIFIPRVLSDGSGQTVYAQVLDAETGKELFVEDVYLEDPRLLPQQISGLIMKIEQRFPLIQAQVRQQEQHLLIDAGADRGAQEGMRLLVIRSDGPFEQGKVLLAGTRPAELIVSEVESEKAQVILSGRQPNPPAQAGDYVFSR